jgi:hypothetical protein
MTEKVEMLRSDLRNMRKCAVKLNLQSQWISPVALKIMWSFEFGHYDETYFLI